MGRETARILLATLNQNLWLLANASEAELSGIVGIGPTTAASIREHFRDPDGSTRLILESLNRLGMVAASHEVSASSSSSNFSALSSNSASSSSLSADSSSSNSAVASPSTPILSSTSSSSSSSFCQGKTFVLTRSFRAASRSTVRDRIEAAGGSVKSSVSKSTHYVVVGAVDSDGSGSGSGSGDDSSATRKIDDARAKGVTILTESEFLSKSGLDPA